MDLFNYAKEKPEIKLRPYQETAIKNSLSAMDKGDNRQLLILATGLGKTICMAELVKQRRKFGKILLLAHREELLDQAGEKISWLNPDINMQIEQASKYAEDNAELVLASVATLGRYDSKRIQRFNPSDFGTVLIDEAHHASAETYQNIINYFVHDKCLLFGVTATPNRSDDEDLSSVFNFVCYKMDIVDGTKQGFLSPIVSHRVSSKTDLSKVRTTAGDFNIKDLANAVNTQERNTLIVDTYLKRFPDKKAIVFCSDLDHASALENEFNKCGIKSVSITGDTDKNLRKQYINDFKSKDGSIKIVLNFGVLTEGFDYEELDLIIQARPTQSQLLLTQIAGRSTRLSEGKSVSHIVEIIDHHSSKTATTAKIFGFRQEFDCEDHDFLECIRKAEEFEREKEFFNPYNCASWSDMLLRYERATKQNPAGNAPFVGGGGGPREFIVKELTYNTFTPSDLYFESRYRYMKSKAGTLKLIHTDKDRDKKYRIQIYPNGLGGCDVTMHSKNSNAGFYDKPELNVSYRCASQAAAAKKIEEYILLNYPEWDILLNINSAWRKRASVEPVTDKQWALVQRYKLSMKPKSELTKAEAMELLSLHFGK